MSPAGLSGPGSTSFRKIATLPTSSHFKSLQQSGANCGENLEAGTGHLHVWSGQKSPEAHGSQTGQRITPLQCDRERNRGLKRSQTKEEREDSSRARCQPQPLGAMTGHKPGIQERVGEGSRLPTAPTRESGDTIPLSSLTMVLYSCFKGQRRPRATRNLESQNRTRREASES